MCGIAGFTGFRDDRSLREMMGALSHRGPDSSDTYCSDNVSLGHMRLKIIDLSMRASQPMENEDGSIKLVFNGEIYNYKNLREDLVNKNHRFRSESDTEVILHQYEEDGIDCVKKFNGMFSFAIWDEKKQRLFLCRDRVGIKPLYYYWDGENFAFSSEIKSLIRCARVKKKFNFTAAAELLMMRYLYSPVTPIENLNKLAPGSFLVFKAGQPPFIDKFWDLPNENVPVNMDDAKDELRALLKDSVEKRLMSDVPLGLMLSGGIDSSVVCALASRSQSDLHTYSIGFQGEPDNEFSPAKETSKLFGTSHREILVSPEHLKYLPEVVWYNDEPVGGPSSVAFYLGLKEAKKDATVLLLGHGADEIFGGYEELKIQKLTRKFAGYPFRPLISSGSKALAKFYKNDRAIERLVDYCSSMRSPAANFFKLISVINDKEINEFILNGNDITSNAHKRIMDNITASYNGSGNPLEGIMDFEIRGWLCEDILLRVDRMSMAHSIEARVPFLDHRIVEFAGRLPLDLKLRLFQDKFLLREAMQGILPLETCQRKKKRFNTPVQRFFSEGFFSMCRRIFSEDNELNETFFRRDELLRLLDYKNLPSYRHFLKYNKLTGQYYARQIWNILVLHLWYKMYIDGKKPEDLTGYAAG